MPHFDATFVIIVTLPRKHSKDSSSPSIVRDDSSKKLPPCVETGSLEEKTPIALARRRRAMVSALTPRLEMFSREQGDDAAEGRGANKINKNVSLWLQERRGMGDADW